jgi:hypothetical protein
LLLNSQPEKYTNLAFQHPHLQHVNPILQNAITKTLYMIDYANSKPCQSPSEFTPFKSAIAGGAIRDWLFKKQHKDVDFFIPLFGDNMERIIEKLQNLSFIVGEIYQTPHHNYPYPLNCDYFKVYNAHICIQNDDNSKLNIETIFQFIFLSRKYTSEVYGECEDIILNYVNSSFDFNINKGIGKLSPQSNVHVNFDLSKIFNDLISSQLTYNLSAISKHAKLSKKNETRKERFLSMFPDLKLLEVNK